MSDILEKILATKAKEVAEARQNISDDEMKQLAKNGPPLRDFTGALRIRLERHLPAVIAEIKKASPSRGVLREDFNPAEIASSYARHGAACLSVLTDREYFQGAPEYLKEARNACGLPVIRKDFIIDEYQVYEARVMGADAILLIVAALQQTQMKQLEQLAEVLGMAVLVESHNEEELQRALQLNTPLIGINNRNLKTFETSLDVTLTLKKQVPKNRIVVTESGIQSKADVACMQQQDIHAFLVGEAFMRAADPGEALNALF